MGSEIHYDYNLFIHSFKFKWWHKIQRKNYRIIINIYEFKYERVLLNTRIYNVPA